MRTRKPLSKTFELWPGFVDALATLLMVMIFALMIFVLSHFYLSEVLTGKEKDLTKLQQNIQQLNSLLLVEKKNAQMLQTSLKTIKTDNEALQSSMKTKEAIANAQLTQLQQEMAQLNEQLLRLNEALHTADITNQHQQIEISTLGAKLNEALASKLKELEKYRSEFFGQLKEALGQRTDIRVVGDRFVFQSEVLFSPGSDVLGEGGKKTLKHLANSLKDLTPKIPKDINWVLRVDGHTDRNPIKSNKFPSNWHLSSARALRVVDYLIEEGIAPRHLAAAGFAEFQPLGKGESEEAFSKNRRIELTLDQKK